MRAEGKGNFTFISGATGGVWRAFAFACAKEGALFLTGRSGEKLSALQAEILQKFPDCRIECFAADLTDENSRRAMYAHIEEAGLTFRRLINVAGADIQKAFEKYTDEKLVFQCRVNLEAALSVTRFVLGRREKGLEIVNISSISGVYPMPYFAVYSATKAALSSFSSSLRLELKREGVKVTAIEPGGIYTRPDVCKDIEGQGLWGKLSAKKPEYIARKSLAAVKKNRRVCRPGFWNKFIACVPRVLPLSLRMRFIARRWSKLEKDAF